MPKTIADIEAMGVEELIALQGQLDAEFGISGAAPTRELLDARDES